jgi:hypothetical protein
VEARGKAGVLRKDSDPECVTIICQESPEDLILPVSCVGSRGRIQTVDGRSGVPPTPVSHICGEPLHPPYPASCPANRELWFTVTKNESSSPGELKAKCTGERGIWEGEGNEGRKEGRKERKKRERERERERERLDKE